MKYITRKNLNIRLRKNRSRAKIFGTASRPRVSVFRSNKFVYAQLIDDTSHRTLISFSTSKIKDKKITKTDAAKSLGVYIGEIAKKEGIKGVVFHKGAYKYHGRVKAVAEGMRQVGLSL